MFTAKSGHGGRRTWCRPEELTPGTTSKLSLLVGQSADPNALWALFSGFLLGGRYRKKAGWIVFPAMLGVIVFFRRACFLSPKPLMLPSFFLIPRNPENEDLENLTYIIQFVP